MKAELGGLGGLLSKCRLYAAEPVCVPIKNRKRSHRRARTLRGFAQGRYRLESRNSTRGSNRELSRRLDPRGIFAVAARTVD